jgi:hypothetical protein
MKKKGHLASPFIGERLSEESHNGMHLGDNPHIGVVRGKFSLQIEKLGS